MEKSNHSRFKDAPWYPKEKTFLLIGGAGGIGSWTSLLLARAGFSPMVFDFDLIEEHNLGGQLYSRSMITEKKAYALQTVIKQFSDEDITAFDEKVTEETLTHPFVISAFDNMEARKVMFKKWVDTYGSTPGAIFIDGRLQAEHMQIFCVTGGVDIDSIRCQKLYEEEYLFNDSEVKDAPCTMKQTSHAAAMIASHIVGFFTNFYTNMVEKDSTRAVPFKWEYFIPMDYISVTT